MEMHPGCNARQCLTSSLVAMLSLATLPVPPCRRISAFDTARTRREIPSDTSMLPCWLKQSSMSLPSPVAMAPVLEHVLVLQHLLGIKGEGGVKSLPRERSVKEEAVAGMPSGFVGAPILLDSDEEVMKSKPKRAKQQEILSAIKTSNRGQRNRDCMPVSGRHHEFRGQPLLDMLLDGHKIWEH